MPQILFVTPAVSHSASGGRGQLSRLHWHCIEQLFERRAALHPIEPSRPGLAGAISGRIDGATIAAERALIERVGAEDVRQLWIDGSNLGRLARAVKRALPAVEVVTFCHNVEARFFLGAFRQRPGARSLAVLLANSVSERMAVRASDRLIALNRRDSDGLRKVHGRAATDILLMAIEEQPANPADDQPPPTGRYLLFVGGAFYANLEGARWFAREVAPRIALPTCLVGHGLDRLRDELATCSNVHVVGAVGDLTPWYRGASAVVAPIFDGSGMKTKVAEALMHGKRVIGTSEAFTGYEDVVAEAGWQCDDAASFVTAIERIGDDAPTFDPALRNLFNRRYSVGAARDRLAAILRA